MRAVERTAPPRDLIQSLQRGLRVLEFVCARDAPVAPKEIARGVGLQLATAYHLINTLIYEGYLERVPGGIVARVSGLRSRADAAPTPPMSVRRALARAAAAAEDVAVLTELHGGEAVVTAVEEADGAPSAGRYLGGTRHLPHLSAAGRAMLAMQPDGAAPQVVEQVRELALRRGEVFDRRALSRQLEAVRRVGVAVEVSGGEACLAAPVVTRRGAVLGAVAVVVTPPRLRRQRTALTAAVQRAALGIAHDLRRFDTEPQPQEETPR